MIIVGLKACSVMYDEADYRTLLNRLWYQMH